MVFIASQLEVMEQVGTVLPGAVLQGEVLAYIIHRLLDLYGEAPMAAQDPVRAHLPPIVRREESAAHPFLVPL